jgi:hypothetical protein
VADDNGQALQRRPPRPTLIDKTGRRCRAQTAPGHLRLLRQQVPGRSLDTRPPQRLSDNAALGVAIGIAVARMLPGEPVLQACISPIFRPGIQHGKDRFGAFLGCGYRGVDVHVVLPERVYPSVLTAHRADGTVAAPSFPLLGDG